MRVIERAIQASRVMDPRVVTLALEDELGVEELQEVGEELFRRMHRGETRVVLDFSEVPHLDYRGVRPLVARAERFRHAGGDIKLCGLSPYLAAIFRAAGAWRAFECYETAAEARASFLPGAEPLRPWR